MENPASWKSAELVIEEALETFPRRREGVIGGSQVIWIANALRKSGHLKDSDEPEIGWDKLRAHWNERKGSQT